MDHHRDSRRRNNQIDPSNRVIFNKSTGDRQSLPSRRAAGSAAADPPAPPSAPPPPEAPPCPDAYQVLPHNAYTYTCGAETRMDQQECKDFADWVSDEDNSATNIASLGLDSTLVPQTFVVASYSTTAFGCNVYPNTGNGKLYIYYDSDSQSPAVSGTVQRAVCKVPGCLPPSAPPPPLSPLSPPAAGAAAVRDRVGRGPLVRRLHQGLLRSACGRGHL